MVVGGAFNGNVLIPDGSGVQDPPPPGAAFGNMDKCGEILECWEFHERFENTLTVR